MNSIIGPWDDVVLELLWLPDPTARLLVSGRGAFVSGSRLNEMKMNSLKRKSLVLIFAACLATATGGN